MNEDIKILEEFAHDLMQDYIYSPDEIPQCDRRLKQAIENLIQRFKVLKAEYKREQYRNELLENKNKELEEENKILKNKQTKIIADSFHEKMAKKFDDDFIPKSKIKEKMKSTDLEIEYSEECQKKLLKEKKKSGSEMEIDNIDEEIERIDENIEALSVIYMTYKKLLED